jgi:hypothetical protein
MRFDEIEYRHTNDCPTADNNNTRIPAKPVTKRLGRSGAELRGRNK